jgi:hypothetical protein
MLLQAKQGLHSTGCSSKNYNNLIICFLLYIKYEKETDFFTFHLL